jgi:hypothetical protein
MMTPLETVRRYLLPEYVEKPIPDHKHPHRRRYTARYRRRLGICKSIWIVSGLVMAVNPTPEILFTLGLGTTFLSFMILDESD